VAIVGVQSGKSRVAAAVAAYTAALGSKHGTYALLLGQDHRAAMRVLFSYAKEPFTEIEAFREELVRETADTIELKTGVSLAAYPCRPAAVRGLRASICIVDELAFFVSTDGRPTDREMLRVARGRVATTGGKVIVLSSPYAETGALYDLHRRHYGREDSPVLVWQASAPEMNPGLSEDYLARAEAEDPDAYQSEVLGQFRSGTSLLFDGAALDACVAAGIRERGPETGLVYHAFVDVAGGSGLDSFALAIAHREADRRIVLDAVRVWTPKFNPSTPVAETAALCRRYGAREVHGDGYARGFTLETFAGHGITYVQAALSTSDHYLELVPHVNTGAVTLLDLPGPLRELRTLVRKRGPSGRDRVDHRTGAHDDQAAAVAGAVVLAAGPAVLDPWDYGLTSSCTW
jgi:hypothetical protein